MAVHRRVTRPGVDLQPDAWDFGLTSYRRLRWSSVGVQELWRVIEPSEKEPPHAPRNYIGSTNLKAILENIDELTKIGAGLDAGVDIERLRQRIADGSAVSSWIDELGEEFGRRNARLRRTRRTRSCTEVRSS